MILSPRRTKSGLLQRLRAWGGEVSRDAIAVYFVARDPRVPWGARFLALSVAAYAFSPIDLIPDMIPVLGFLDDAVLIPLGILLVVRMVPKLVMFECRAKAAMVVARPVARAGEAAIVGVWVSAVGVAGWFAHRFFFGRLG